MSAEQPQTRRAVLALCLVGVFAVGLICGRAWPWARDRAATAAMVDAFVLEAASEGPITVKPAEFSLTAGISYTPPHAVGGVGSGPASSALAPLVTGSPELARKLLRHPSALVRARTAFLIVRSDQPVSREVISEVKHLVLTDPNDPVRAAALIAFDQPFDFTPPHLFLSAREIAALMERPLVGEVVLHLLAKGRCRESGSTWAEAHQFYDSLAADLTSPDPVRRWSAYNALSRLVDSSDLARDTILRIADGAKYFGDAVFHVMFTASSEDLSAVRRDVEKFLADWRDNASEVLFEL